MLFFSRVILDFSREQYVGVLPSDSFAVPVGDLWVFPVGNCGFPSERFVGVPTRYIWFFL